MPDALAIATFPTLLLITTLFRLALNVSSTRLILLQANAGEVIRAFGQFVVRGNYVVGGVIFLILTIIQFIVIAKGSERVAEVGARFVLDAMPGKQMAIDAELRSGAIDGNEARRRRRHARAREPVLRRDGRRDEVRERRRHRVAHHHRRQHPRRPRDRRRAEAACPRSTRCKRYGLLTIGDGLVTQIPALVLSTAAGILVTRVASEEPDTPLGEELASQLFGMPKALRVASGFVLAPRDRPGAARAAVPRHRRRRSSSSRARARAQIARDEQRAATEPRAVAARRRARADAAFVPMVVPWSIEVSEDLASAPRRRARRSDARACAA